MAAYTTTEKEIRNTLKAMQDDRNPREGVWEDIIQYILPGLETIWLQNIDKPGKRLSINRYDGTGVSALQLFADGLFGYLISPSIAWLRLTMKEEIMQIPEVREWLQDLEAYYYEIFNQTNFYDSISTYFEYAPALGFADMYMEEDIGQGKIVFKVYHPGSVYLKENKFGQVDTVYRTEILTAEKAVEKFGKDNVGSNLLKDYNDNKPAKYDFIHAVFPRRNYDIMKLTGRNKPFASLWLQLEAGKENPDGLIVRESGYDRFPHMVWRFKKGVTPYGTGPGEDALTEVLGANEIQKSMLKAAQKSVEPPMNVPGEMVGNIDLGPNGINYYSDPAKIVRPVDRGVDFPIGIDREERIQRAIERHFKVEFFTLLSTLSLREGGSRRTATEIIELQGEKAAVLGRPINRLNNECLNMIIDNIFDIELKADRLPPMPAVLEDLQGEKIDPDYMGPLAQAQKKMFQVQGISQGLAQIGPLAEMKPEALDVINADKTAKTILTVAGYPQDCMNDEEAIRIIREARARIQEQETAKEDLERMGKLVESGAKAEKMLGAAIPSEMMEMAGEA